MQIRPFDIADEAAIDTLLREAFAGAAEAVIVKALRAADADTLELVAERDERVIGTVMFSPVTAVLANGTESFGLGLGPMAVHPDFQSQGVGSALIEAGLTFVRTLGVPWCVVLGDPDYYGRFGFAVSMEPVWRWDGDPEGAHAAAFQRLSLSNDNWPPGEAILSYHPAFTL
jgi:putative acetyltransferase